MERRFLLPGESTFCRSETMISTLLGSCVAVCLHDARNGWGGMNHYMLPEDTGGGLEPGKYGDVAIRNLIQVARTSGCRKNDLVAKLYGGGHVIGHLGAAGSTPTTSVSGIPERNAEVAREFMKKLSIPIVEEDLGGNLGRKIHMHSGTGEVRCTPIQRLSENVQQEDKVRKIRGRKIRVLVVDDSPTVRRLLGSCISDSEDLEVCAYAEDPYEAREKILESDPDVISLDVVMPRMDGNTFLKKLMKYKPIPVVIVSTIAKQGSAMSAKLKNNGAIEIFDKDELKIYQGLDYAARQYLPALRRAATTVVEAM